MVAVSIVIPVYNTENFLENCINSATNQSLRDIEIICVDDCSTDNSLRILENLAAKDQRIKILKNEKTLKTFAARAKGLMAATGKYILCLDSDDELIPNIAESMLSIAEAEQADIVHFQMRKYDKDGKFINDLKFCGNPKHNSQVFGKDIARLVIIDKISCTVGGKFFRTSVVQESIAELEKASGVLSKSVLMCEDFLFILAIGLFAKKYVPNNEIGYKYIQHPASVMHTKSSCDGRMLQNLHDICIIAESYNKLLNKRGAPELQKLFRKHVQWRAKSLSHRPNLFENQIQAAHIVSNTHIFNNKTLAKIIFKIQLRNLSRVFDNGIINLYKILFSKIATNRATTAKAL